MSTEIKVDSLHKLGVIYTKNWVPELDRASSDEETLKTVYKAILQEIENMLNAHHKAKRQSKPYVAGLNHYKSKVSYAYEHLLKRCKGVMESQDKILNGCDEAERDARIDAFQRIPSNELDDLANIEPKLREEALLGLIEKYKGGSGNGSFSAAMLEVKGYNSPYRSDDLKHEDGTKRRPQFIYEMIGRLIYGAMHPEEYKQVFFHRTDRVVAKWNHNHRQVRTEGRLGMLKVLMALLPYLDFKKSLRLGKPSRDQDFKGISIKSISESSNISEWAVSAALRNMEKIGLLNPAKQPYEEYEKEDGTVGFKGLASVRTIKKELIVRLGLGERWLFERKIKNVNKLPKEFKERLDELTFANLHPELYSQKERAFLDIEASLADIPAQ